MRFVDEQLIHAQLLKGDHIVLATLVMQPFQFGQDLLFGPLHLLYREPVASVCLDFRYAVHDLLQLLPEVFLLPFNGQGNLFQLAVSDDDSVVVPGGDPAAQPLAVLCLKVLCRRHQNIGAGIELEIFACPLIRNMIRNDDQALVTKAQAFSLLRQSDHCEGLASPHDMSQQHILPI